MTEELKACPFCGGSPSHKAWSNPSGEYGPGCTECGVTADSCAVWNSRAQLPSQGGEAVEVVASIAVDAEGVVRDFTLEPGLDRHPGGYTVTSLMTVAQHKRILAAQQQSDAVIVPRAIAERMAIDAAQYEHEHAVVNDNVQLWQQPSARLTLTVGDLRTVRALLGGGV